jgi:small subunit ribosomal protein S20
MAHHASAKKKIRRDQRFYHINRARLSRVRTFFKKALHDLDAGVFDKAKTSVKVAQKEIMRGAAKGVLHKNTAARRISRLSLRLKSLSS